MNFAVERNMKTQRGGYIYKSTLSLIRAVDRVGGQRHAPAALPQRKRHVTYCTGVWVGPIAGLDGCGKSRLQPGLDSRIVQSVASRCIMRVDDKISMRCTYLEFCIFNFNYNTSDFTYCNPTTISHNFFSLMLTARILCYLSSCSNWLYTIIIFKFVAAKFALLSRKQTMIVRQWILKLRTHLRF